GEAVGVAVVDRGEACGSARPGCAAVCALAGWVEHGPQPVDVEERRTGRRFLLPDDGLPVAVPIALVETGVCSHDGPRGIIHQVDRSPRVAVSNDIIEEAQPMA